MEKYFSDRLIQPRFGKMPISELARADVQRFVNEVGDDAPANARHCRNVLRQAFNYAMREELATSNPAQMVTLPAPKSRERVLTDKELRAIWKLAGERIGIPRFIVSRVLNQISDTGGGAAVTGVYDRNEYLPEKRKALDAWAALLAEIVAGKEAGVECGEANGLAADVPLF